MFQSSIVNILSRLNTESIEKSEFSNYSWRKWAKAGSIFAITTGAFLALKATGSFSMITTLFGSTPKSDGLTENGIAKITDDSAASGQVGVISMSPYKRTIQPIHHDGGLGISMENSRESVGLAEFEELPLHDFKKRQPSLFPEIIELSSLDGTNGFKLDGEAASDYSGRSVSAAGDINGDGVGDIIVGAYGADPSGRSYVVFGHSGTWTSPIELSSLDGSNGFKLDGEAASDYSGLSVSAAGDINGDGVADLIVGAVWADPSGRSGAGRSYVVFGHSGTWPSPIELSSLDGSNGFKLDGEAAGDWSGYSVSTAGDINGDDVADLIVGARYADPSGRSDAGRSYVVFGHNGAWPSPIELASLNGSNGFKLDGETSFDESGYSVSAAGDINGDGVADLIVGAYWADPSGKSNAGRSYVVFGHNGTWPSPIELSNLNGSNGFKLDGEAEDDYSGRSVSAAGDINGDGVADLIVGAFEADPSGRSGAGRSYVVFGHNGTWTSPIELSSLDGSNGFKLDGEAEYDNSGVSVSAAGDINGDGVGDIIVGARYADPSGRSGAGRSYVVFGHNGTWTSPIELSSLDGSNGFKLDGEAASDYSGLSVSAAGDINGDGVADLIVGAYGADPSGQSKAGRSYVVFGNSAPVLVNNQLTINEGQTIVLNSTNLNATDINNDDNSLKFIVNSVFNGQFEAETSPGNWEVATSFTQQQIIDSQVRFVHDSSENAPGYDVTVSDGNASTSPASAAITFQPLSSAETSSARLSSVKDTSISTSPIGSSLSRLFSSATGSSNKETSRSNEPIYSDSMHDEGLSSAAITGIILGTITTVGLCVVGGFFAVKKTCKPNRDQSIECIELDLTIPATFRCSLTGKMMNEPVEIAGERDCLYDREAIEQYFAMKHKSPTGKSLKELVLIPNYDLRSKIDEYKETIEQPSAPQLEV